MCEACEHIISVYARNKRYNPTQTGGISRAYGAEMARRFTELRKVITDAIVTQDVFGLNKPTVFIQSGQFDFIRSADKVSAFMEWLQKQVDNKILSVAEGTQLGQAIEQSWQNKYLTDSYSKGITRARYELDKAGFSLPTLSDTGGVAASLRAPFHMDRLGLIYSRAYTELKNITNAMDNQISRVLAQGIADGDSPCTLASKLNAVIKGGGGNLGITDTLGRFIPAERRAAMIARTEVIRAHHAATIQEYRNWGAEGVKVMAEFSALGDACPECQELATGGTNNDGVYTLDEIEGMIPVHPNCRCLALPYLPEEAETEAGTGEDAAKVALEDSGEAYALLPDNFQEAESVLGGDESFESVKRSKGLTGEFSRPPLSFYYKQAFGSEEAAQKLAKEVLDNSGVFMAQPDSNILKIIKDNEFKNSLQTGKGTFKTIGVERAQFEHKAFGVVDDVTQPEAYPKYGFMPSKDGMTYEDITGWGYGENYIEFKPSIRNRVSVTFGDSYDSNKGVYFKSAQEIAEMKRQSELYGIPEAEMFHSVAPPTSLTNPKASFFKPRLMRQDQYEAMKAAKNADDLGSLVGSYVEAQIYGKVDLSEVEAIYVSSKTQALKIEKALKKAGFEHIKVKSAKYDVRLGALMGDMKQGYTKASQYIYSLSNADIDNLGESYIDSLVKIHKDNIGYALRDTNGKARNRKGVENIFKGYDKLVSGDMSLAQKKEWLKEVYDDLRRGEDSMLNYRAWKDYYNPKYSNWVGDVANEDIVKKYWK